ncbi:hypothetical protein SFUMM280S_11533 [Streptomyces fumanus]
MSTPATVTRAPSPAAPGETPVASTDQSRPVQRAITAVSLATLYPALHRVPRPRTARPNRSGPRTCRAQRSEVTVVTEAAARCPTR